MEYELTVRKLEKNPEYNKPRMHYEKEEPMYLHNEQLLQVCLKEEEFVAIKKAVIEVIK